MTITQDNTTETSKDDVAVIRITARLDFTSAGAARNQYADAIAEGKPRLIVDLSQVEFVDSSGLGSLISGMRISRQAGGDLVIANPTDQARSLLALTSLDKVLRVYPSIEEAENGFLS